MAFQTSGSTGFPKTIFHKKKYLVASAEKTLEYFQLKQGDTALLILPAQYTGGVMMLIRALVGGLKLHLIEPKLSVPEVLNVDFLPTTPAQFHSMLEHKALKHFTGKILLGGAPSQKELDVGSLKVYEGYGMTETASHVALRKYGEQVFNAIKGVQFSLEGESLIITAPHLGIDGLRTNDAAALTTDTSFKLLGRIDDVIISGGIKIHPEKMESELHHLGLKNVYVSSRENEQLGEQLVLVHTQSLMEFETARAVSSLPRSHRPKWGFKVEEKPLLPSGKLDRKKLRKLIREFPHLLFPL